MLYTVHKDLMGRGLFVGHSDWIGPAQRFPQIAPAELELGTIRKGWGNADYQVRQLESGVVVWVPHGWGMTMTVPHEECQWIPMSTDPDDIAALMKSAAKDAAEAMRAYRG